MPWSWRERRPSRAIASSPPPAATALYGQATHRALWYHHAWPPMTISVDEEPAWETPTLMQSVLVGRREGGFVIAPQATLDDGWFAFVHAGKLSVWQVLRFLPR